MVCCLALEVGREKALASAGHMTTKHPEFVGVLNWHTITYDKQQEKAPWGRGCCYTLYTVVMYSPNAYQFCGVCHSYENKRLLSIKRLLLGLLGRLLNH